MPTDIKRDLVKYCRDRVKSRYNKTGVCDICGSTDGVDFHHFHSVTGLLEKWLKEQGIKITCEQDILDVRDRFIETYEFELVEDAVNLCHKHHEKLHKIYGPKPLLSTAAKQRAWIIKQKEKLNGEMVVKPAGETEPSTE